MVDCEFSETTFGFAITFELLHRFGTLALPSFLTLREEVIYGYDMAFEIQEGDSFSPLFFQFKVPESLNPNHPSSKPARQGLNLTNPSYKFRIYTQPPRGHNSSQHEKLLRLNSITNHVYYASPEFNEDHRLENLFRNRNIVPQTAFFKPEDVGELDRRHHYIYYDEQSDIGYVCSEPEKVKRFKFPEIKEQMKFSYSWNQDSLRKLYRKLADIAEKSYKKPFHEYPYFLREYYPEFLSPKFEYFLAIRMIARLYFGCEFFPVIRKHN